MISITDLVHSVTGRTPKSSLTTNEKGATPMYEGTRHHAEIARHIKFNEIPAEPTICFRQYLAFRADHPTWIPLSDLCERDVKWGCVYGRIDCAFTTPTGLILVEWKRSKMDVGTVGTKMMRSPLRHLQCTNENAWALQLGLGAILVVGDLKLDVRGYTSVVMHPDRPAYQIVRVKDLRPESRTLMDDYLAKRRGSQRSSRGSKRPGWSSSAASKRR